MRTRSEVARELGIPVHAVKYAEKRAFVLLRGGAEQKRQHFTRYHCRVCGRTSEHGVCCGILAQKVTTSRLVPTSYRCCHCGELGHTSKTCARRSRGGV